LFFEVFMSDTEIIGLARPAVEVRGGWQRCVLTTGVEVWLLTGCSMPVILGREGDDTDGRPTYTIKGVALVDTVNIRGKCCNIMNGEAWRAAQKEDFEWINII
jgi:hypothetical protein